MSESVVAVADGHGSATCFRSAQGAEFAAGIALLLMGQPGIEQELVRRWRTAVETHLAQNPFSADELAMVSPRSLRTPWMIYGSTLLAASVSASDLSLLQIGDGDILLVSASGQVRRPWPKDARLLGVETTSLCTHDAAANIRVLSEPLGDESPRLILLCSDGYSNSFREDAGFLRVGTDLLEMMEEDGLETVEAGLEGWLEEASRLGSGDDVTLGLLYRCP